MRQPKLVRIDLSHPRISTRSTYLVHLDGKWQIGRFTKEWFGWSFEDRDGTSHQLDGEDGSVWKSVYRLS